MNILKQLLCVAALAAAPLAQAADMTDGEVRKIDKDAKKITLKHAEIKSLDMPAMTMVFQVRNPALLDAVKPGDKVKFAVEMVGTTMVITEISAVK
jgi:Cu(I)/Ag(I) efflux system periplasmic protein CusF